MYESFLAIKHDVQKCTKCELHASRSHAVFGEGNVYSEIMFIGEAPGYQEDQLARPFVGKAGQLLDKMLGAIELTRNDVYIANVLKCRPPGNADPQPEQVASCIQYLREQVRFICPRLIVCLGRISASYILGKQIHITKDRGQLCIKGNVLILPTLHPSALLRDESLKKYAWEDFKLIKELINNGFEPDLL